MASPGSDGVAARARIEGGMRPVIGGLKALRHGGCWFEWVQLPRDLPVLLSQTTE